MNGGPSPICAGLNAQIAALQNTITTNQAVIADSLASQYNKLVAQQVLDVAKPELASLEQDWLANGCNALPLHGVTIVGVEATQAIQYFYWNKSQGSNYGPDNS